jgi:hypothetical protein
MEKSQLKIDRDTKDRLNKFKTNNSQKILEKMNKQRYQVTFDDAINYLLDKEGV